jgi:hypothetical protein
MKIVKEQIKPLPSPLSRGSTFHIHNFPLPAEEGCHAFRVTGWSYYAKYTNTNIIYQSAEIKVKIHIHCERQGE